MIRNRLMIPVAIIFIILFIIGIFASGCGGDDRLQLGHGWEYDPTETEFRIYTQETLEIGVELGMIEEFCEGTTREELVETLETLADMFPNLSPADIDDLVRADQIFREECEILLGR